MNFEIRKLVSSQLEEVDQLLKSTAAWLQSKGRRQRIANTDLAMLKSWQAADFNYGVYSGNRLACFFALPIEGFDAWPTFESYGQVTWLRALATHVDFRGQKVGEFAIQESFRIVGEGEPIYLDCVSDFLPNYYQKLGFEILAEQTREYPGDGVYEISLLRHKNG